MGEAIYQDAKFMIDYSKKSIANAKALKSIKDNTFRVGTSMLNPAKPFMNLWYIVNKDFPNHKLHLIPFEDNHEGILKEIAQLGKKFDFLIGVCDSKEWLSMCNFLPLGRYKKMVAVSQGHRLANRKVLKLEDLYGETLMMVKRGDSPVNDFLRNDLELHHPKIHIEDTPQYYDISVFNHCAESNKVLLLIECWKDVHPSLVAIPVEWEYSIPYGLLYSLNPSESVLRFIDVVSTMNTNSNDIT
jgi:DNA-binding transcriptional LysR family regulator